MAVEVTRVACAAEWSSLHRGLCARVCLWRSAADRSSGAAPQETPEGAHQPRKAVLGQVGRDMGVIGEDEGHPEETRVDPGGCHHKALQRCRCGHVSTRWQLKKVTQFLPMHTVPGGPDRSGAAAVSICGSSGIRGKESGRACSIRRSSYHSAYRGGAVDEVWLEVPQLAVDPWREGQRQRHLPIERAADAKGRDDAGAGKRGRLRRKARAVHSGKCGLRLDKTGGEFDPPDRGLIARGLTPGPVVTTRTSQPCSRRKRIWFW